MQIILVAALAEEADAFYPGYGEPLDCGWPQARRLTVHGHDVIVAWTGIGKVNITAGAARLHALYGADLIAITGTAGKLSSITGNCFFLNRAVQHDYGARRADAFVHYDPGAWPIGPASISPYHGIADPGTGLPAACIVSGDAFIADAAFARHLVAALDGDVVDMETGALAQYAKAVGLPWTGIKATTDDANHDSAGDFHANLLAASKRAASAMDSLIARL